MESSFTNIIKDVLKQHFGDEYEAVYENSNLLQYINIKTRSANRGPKSRGSFANLYALYVLIEDYINNHFHENGEYQNMRCCIFVFT